MFDEENNVWFEQLDNGSGGTGEVSKSYVDNQDKKYYELAKKYADEKAKLNWNE